MNQVDGAAGNRGCGESRFETALQLLEFTPFQNCLWQNKTVSRDGERLQKRDRNRLKALTLSFHSVPVSYFSHLLVISC